MKSKKYILGLLFAFLFALTVSVPFSHRTNFIENGNSVQPFGVGDEVTEGEEKEPETETGGDSGNEGEETEEFFKVTIETVGQGVVSIQPNEESYLKDTVLTVVVSTSKGWKLTKLEGVELDEDNSFAIVADTKIEATFELVQISLSDEEKGVSLETTADIVEEGSTMNVTVVTEDDTRFSQVKNLLSNQDKLAIFDVSLFDSEGVAVEQLDGDVLLKIKLDEMFDAEKIKVFRVDISGSKTECVFTVEEGVVVIETDHFSLYTISQTSGFKPVSPSKDGTNVLALFLFILGGTAGVIVVGVVIYTVVRKKKN